MRRINAWSDRQALPEIWISYFLVTVVVFLLFSTTLGSGISWAGSAVAGVVFGTLFTLVTARERRG